MDNLAKSREELNEVLKMLDEIGAWVSAIYVATAIEKLPEEGTTSGEGDHRVINLHGRYPSPAAENREPGIDRRFKSI